MPIPIEVRMGEHPGAPAFTPEMRDIWQAVRERTPANALVFTDEVADELGLISSANTYVQHGQRQVFFAAWMYSARFRNDAEGRRARLQLNNAVLRGQRAPADIPTSRSYGGFFAVVAATRAMPDDWRPLYRNDGHALYEWAR